MAITKVSSELIKDNSITMDKMHTGVVVTTSEGLHNNANDTVLPTAGAVAAYVTSQVTGADNWDLSFAWGDHSTYGYATETYVDNSIANVINSAPATLDTLNELAAALGDDPNFATTVTNLIAGKQDAGTYNTIIGTDTDINTSGATIVDNIYVTDGVITSMGTRTLTLGDLGYTGATNANYITNNNQLTNGAGYITSFDITTQTDPKYLRSNANDTASGKITMTYNESGDPLAPLEIRGAGNHTGLYINPYASKQAHVRFATDGDLKWQIRVPFQDGANTPLKFYSWDSAADKFVFNTDGSALFNGGSVWTSVNDGSGSGLDADLLDGLQGSQFLRSDASDVMSGNLNLYDGNLWIQGDTSNKASISLSESTVDKHLVLEYNGTGAGAGNYFSMHSEVAGWVSQGAGFNYIPENGRVGIGTTTPTQALDVAGNVTANVYYDRQNTSYYLTPADGTTSANLLGDIKVNGGKIHIKRGVGLTTTIIEDDSTASGRGQLLLDSHYSDLIIASRNTNANKHGSSITLATQSTSTNDYAKWVIGQGQYQEGADELAFAYGTNFTNPHSVLGTDNANAAFRIFAASGGYTLSKGSSRAPLFYDSNNTGYYLNPAGTSSLLNINMNNGTLSNLNNLTFNDPGPNEGIEWIGGNGWKIFESPDDLATNTGGNLQFVTGGTRRMTIDTSGLLIFGGDKYGSTNYSKSVGGISNSGYTNICNISGNALASCVKMSFTGTTGGVVVDVVAEILVNHSQDITIKTHAGNYTRLTLKVISNGNENFSVQATTNSSNPVTLGVFVFPLNGESVSFSTTSANSVTTLTHDCYPGEHTSSNGNASNSRTSGYVSGKTFYDYNNTGYYLDPSFTGDSIRVAGDIVAYYSDERLKDIKGNIENAVDKVKQLNGFYYSANETAQKLGYKVKDEVGVSAQEVEKVLPEIIKDAPIGQGYKTLDYSKIVPLLIEAIKEQQTQIDELKQLINKQ